MPRRICVSFAFLSLILSDALPAQALERSDTKAGVGSTDTSATFNPSTGESSGDNAVPGQSPPKPEQLYQSQRAGLGASVAASGGRGPSQPAALCFADCDDSRDAGSAESV